MTRRRTVLVLVLAGACLAVVAALLSATGASGWRLKATAASAAVALFAAAILQARVNTVLDRRRHERAELERGIFMPGTRPPLVRDITDPRSAGVHAAARRVAGARVPPYVPRDVDPVLHQALRGSRFVLLSGTAA